MNTPARSREPDPRIERSRRVVRQAALEELGDVGYGAFTIESVAARSGVAKSTIYRHWPGKLPLIADALETLNEQPNPTSGAEAEGDPRERVEQLVRHLAEVFVDSTLSACIPALIEAAERDPDVRQFHHRYNRQRRQVLVDAIAEGVATGEFRPELDPEIAAIALVGPIIYRRVMTGRPLDPDHVSTLIDTVIGPSRGR
ncbi:MAG: TetR/AcrR family transcriptional regulator [Solirubrobacteraceae bacterium]